MFQKIHDKHLHFCQKSEVNFVFSKLSEYTILSAFYYLNIQNHASDFRKVGENISPHDLSDATDCGMNHAIVAMVLSPFNPKHNEGVFHFPCMYFN